MLCLRGTLTRLSTVHIATYPMEYDFAAPPLPYESDIALSHSMLLPTQNKRGSARKPLILSIPFLSRKMDHCRLV